MAVGPQETVLAPRFSRVLTVLVIVICGITEVSLVAYGHVDLLVKGTPALALLAFGAYALFWAPLVKITPDGAEVVNPLRTHRIPWGAVDDVSTRWGLSFTTREGLVRAWASPAESPWGSLGRLRRDALGRPSLGPADNGLPRSTAGLTPALVQRQWEAYRDEAVGAGGTPSVRWHWVTIAVLALLIVATIVAIAVP